ncbi:hypothetical protein [Aldersonia kunmingensis]|uniref:hypothetical protein n=1 Tax=Aldersonia kunmingensis TaxID=408066 RepID=UPI00082DE47C|nr:hypothetical protein [Aldersonia kunmingensis]
MGIEAAYEDAAAAMACNMMDRSALEMRRGVHREAHTQLDCGDTLDGCAVLHRRISGVTINHVDTTVDPAPSARTTA